MDPTASTLNFMMKWSNSKFCRQSISKGINEILIGIASSIHQGHDWLAVRNPSLIHSSRSLHYIKTVQFPNQFSLSFVFFLMDQVLSFQIRTEEET